MAFTLVEEWEHEAKQTRKVLERVPADKLGWKPHQKSASLGSLAMHVANIPSWAHATLLEGEYNFTGEQMPEPRSTQEILAHFDKTSAEMLEALKAAKPMDDPWHLKFQGNIIFTQSRGATARTFLFSHFIHHRAQLTVYLRLLDVPVPGLYGPSADER